MGKSKRSDKEYSREQRLSHENQRLKKQISGLRKQLARIDLDRYSHLKETLEQHYNEEDEKQQSIDILEKVKKHWACHEPGCEGFLEIFLYTRLNDTWYFRQCSDPDCDNRTKAKKYDPNLVKGILKKGNN